MLWNFSDIWFWPKNTIKDGSSTVLLTAHTVCSVYTVCTVYTVSYATYTAYTAYFASTANTADIYYTAYTVYIVDNYYTVKKNNVWAKRLLCLYI